MMERFKFVGGPWNGEYHEVDHRRTYVDVPNPIRLPPFKPLLIEAEIKQAEAEAKAEAKAEAEENGVEVEIEKIEPLESTRYTFRLFRFPEGELCFFADSELSEWDIFSQLIHHHKGPR
jgi:hypothetical protein